MKCQCIHRHRAAFALGLMCRVLAVPRSSYYAWRARGPSRRGEGNALLQARIRVIYAESDQTYGSPLRALEYALVPPYLPLPNG